MKRFALLALLFLSATAKADQDALGYLINLGNFNLYDTGSGWNNNCWFGYKANQGTASYSTHYGNGPGGSSTYSGFATADFGYGNVFSGTRSGGLGNDLNDGGHTSAYGIGDYAPFPRDHNLTLGLTGATSAYALDFTGSSNVWCPDTNFSSWFYSTNGYTGNGAALTNLNAANLTGSINTNVAKTIANIAVPGTPAGVFSSPVLGFQSSGQFILESASDVLFGSDSISDYLSAPKLTNGIGAGIGSDNVLTAVGSGLTSIPAGQLTGTVATARLGSGTANSSTYLRGDQTWATVSGGSGNNFSPLFVTNGSSQIELSAVGNNLYTLGYSNTFGNLWGAFNVVFAANYGEFTNSFMAGGYQNQFIISDGQTQAAAESSIIGGGLNRINSGNGGGTFFTQGDGIYEGWSNNMGAATYSTMLGGFNNSLSTASGSVTEGVTAGGDNNAITSGYSAGIFGSEWSSINVYQSTLGRNNNIFGGESNSMATLSMIDSTIVGGARNAASASYDVAMGENASASYNNSFVWSDGTTFGGTSGNQFLVHSSGGVGVNTNNPSGYALNVNGNSYTSSNATALGTNTTGELLVNSGGITLGGVRNTSWPSGTVTSFVADSAGVIASVATSTTTPTPTFAQNVQDWKNHSTNDYVGTNKPVQYTTKATLTNIDALANSAGVLTNNGSGSLSWVAVGGSGGSGTTNLPSGQVITNLSVVSNIFLTSMPSNLPQAFLTSSNNIVSTNPTVNITLTGDGSGLTNITKLTNSTTWGTATNNAVFTVSNYVATATGTGWTNSTARRGLLTVHFGWSTSAGSPAGATLYITNYDGTVVTHPWYQGGLTGLSESGTNFLSGMIGSNSSVNLIGTSGTITVTSNNIDWQ